MHTLHDSESRKWRRAVIGLMTMVLALASGALCAQGAPAAKPAPGQGDATAAPPAHRSQSGPPATPGAAAGDRVCGPDLGPGRGLKEADLDGDGKISRAEFMQMHEVRFERLPKDRNGLVSVEDAMRQGPMGPGEMSPRGGPAGSPTPDGRAAPGSSPRRPGTNQPQPPSSPMSPATPEPGMRPSGSNSPDGEPDRGPPAPTGEAASSRTSSPSSTPSSTSPQERKPGR